jgi:hypothetical protein
MRLEDVAVAWTHASFERAKASSDLVPVRGEDHD